AALGDAVAMAAVGAGDAVLVGEVHAHADGRGLLAGIEMHEAGDVAGGELLLDAVLEGADRAHVAIGADQLGAIELHGVPPRSMRKVYPSLRAGGERLCGQSHRFRRRNDFRSLKDFRSSWPPR